MRTRSLQNRGFTLIEMIIALALLGVLIGVGVPSMRHSLSESRLSGAASDMLADMYVARAAAVKLQCDVSIAPANTATWNQGWVVSYSAVSATNPQCEPVSSAPHVTKNLKLQGPLTEVVVTGPLSWAGSPIPLVFRYDGSVELPTWAWDMKMTGVLDAFTFAPKQASDRVQGRCVQISPGGMPHVVRDKDFNISNGC